MEELKSTRRGSALRKKGRIKEQFVPVRYEMLKSELFNSGYLKPIDMFFYIQILAQKNGDPEHDAKLIYSNSRACRFVSSSTFSLSKFRLWAFRCLEVTEWGRKDKVPTRFEESLRWKTLIRQPYKLKRIATLVRRYEKVFNFHPKNRPKRTKDQRTQKKHAIYRKIKSKIIDIP
jgi:hypothetical protein